MPFAMTHLNIAYNIIKTTPEIKNPNDFMLGAVAPDSVHFRKNYISEMKFNSHLCIGNEKWGSITNNNEWVRNILLFLKQNKNSSNVDFIYGYCSHILADIQNNKKIWTPFIESINGRLDKGIRGRYHEESNAIDFDLYKSHTQKEIWKILHKSKAYNISNIVNEKEINLMKESLLNNQFKNRESVDVSKHEYVTLSKINEFIKEESCYIKEILYNS